MNVLDHTYPIGVEVNTFSIRTNHVDLDEDGADDAVAAIVSSVWKTTQFSHNTKGNLTARLILPAF